VTAGFAGALIVPQWQGVGRRIGYRAGNALLRRLLPDSLPRIGVDCPDVAALDMEDGVKGLSLLAATADRIAAARQRIGGPALTIGGDCAADLINAASANAVTDTALIWIDGHADLNNPAVSPSGHYHGMVVASLMGDGPASLTRHVTRPYRPDQVFYAGIRDCDPAESDRIATHDIFALPVGAANAGLIAAIKARGFTRVHLHLDLDVLDPQVFPYIGVPAAEGLDLDQLCTLLQDLRAAFALAGASITECNLANEAEAALARPMLARILQDGFGLA